MPLQPNLQVVQSPYKGLVTDAPPFSYPENAFTEGYDIVVDEKGKLTRRLGFEYETSYVEEAVTYTATSVVQEYTWPSVAGNGDTVFNVYQLGDTLYFYSLDSTDPQSGNKHAHTVALSTYAVSGSSSIESDACDFANGNGVLIVVHPQCEPFYVSYDSSANTFSETQIELQIRDFEGVEDGLVVDERPSSIDVPHRYNLYNQGWNVTMREDATNTETTPYSDWDAGRSDFPSNADIPWVWKDENEQLDVTWISRTHIGTTPAPKGHYVLNPFSQQRDDVSGLAVTDVTTTARPSCVAFYAGRAFYSGVNDSGWNNDIYFSQIIINDEYNLCYQANDPTSEFLSDLLATDGGVIKIPEAGTVVALHPIGNYLLVFATNGIWSISGAENSSFKATDYAVSKLSDVSAISKNSIVAVSGIPFWWNTDGIHTVTMEPTLQTLNIEHVSDKVIRNFYVTIPETEMRYVKGIYNPRTDVLTWLYRTTASSTVQQRTEYDAALNYNRLTKAFYPWTISQPANGPRIVGIFTNASVRSAETETFFLTLRVNEGSNYYLTYSKEHDTDYLDWTAFDSTGTDYDSYLITGYAISGSGFFDFFDNYINIISEREANASCFVRGLWGYANDEASNRWSVAQQLYNDDSTYGYRERRLKIRGNGKALQLKFESDSGKPFTIVGYTFLVMTEQGP